MYKILLVIKLGHFGGDGKATAMEIVSFETMREADTALMQIRNASVNDLTAIPLY